jgi:uncharacterized Zn finger protein (UPF0148 family)
MSLKNLLNDLADNDTPIFFTETKKAVSIIENNNTLCPNCNIRLARAETEGYLVCPNCSVLYPWGYSEEKISNESGSGHDFVKKYHVDSKKIQEKKTEDEFIKHTNGNRLGIKKEYVFEAIEAYKMIQQQHKIIRGDIRTSVMAACLVKICDANSHYLTPEEISKQFNITRNYLADGIKYLDSMIESNIVTFKEAKTIQSNLSIVTEEDRKIHNILERYYDKLGKPKDQYFDFIYKSVRFLIKYQLFIKCVTVTKCVGMIYLTYNMIGQPIKKKTISDELQIAINTFMKFCNLLINFLPPLLAYSKVTMKKCKRLRRLWKKYNVPIPTKQLTY